MSNIFIANSKFNLEKLKENKAFLLNLISQLREAYIIGYYKESDSGDTTEIEIGSRNSEYDTHKFSVNGKGVITFQNASTQYSNKDAKMLLKKYPNSRVQWTKDYYKREHGKDIPESENNGWIDLSINITKSNINDAIKDIVVTLETAGHAPAFTLRR